MNAVLEADAHERLRIMRSAKSVALVGVSANPIRSSNFVASYLIRTDFVTYPVNPMYDEVLGMKCYPSLQDLPQVVWFQLGLRNDEAARMALDAGLAVVQDRCLKIEHARFAGGLHLGGFDTGVITSKRRRAL